MLPMCYPADHNDGVFIPNWALWFVVELEEYLARSGDRETVDALRPRVLRLFDYFKKFRNEDGLLEKLESWVFVEWSAANSFVQDVNYPSNMLYAKALSTPPARCMACPDLTDDAEQHPRDHPPPSPSTADFFVDNAKRVNGKLQVTTNRTEVCQYFAFFFDVAKPETHSELWQRLVKDFGPQRKQTKAFPEVHPGQRLHRQRAAAGTALALRPLPAVARRIARLPALHGRPHRHALGERRRLRELRPRLRLPRRRARALSRRAGPAAGGYRQQSRATPLHRLAPGLVRRAHAHRGWPGRRSAGARRAANCIYQVTAPAGYTIQIENRSALPAVRQ